MLKDTFNPVSFINFNFIIILSPLFSQKRTYKKRNCYEFCFLYLLFMGFLITIKFKIAKFQQIRLLEIGKGYKVWLIVLPTKTIKNKLKMGLWTIIILAVIFLIFIVVIGFWQTMLLILVIFILILLIRWGIRRLFYGSQ